MAPVIENLSTFIETSRKLTVKLLMAGGTQRFPLVVVNRYDSVFNSRTTTDHE
jgi:hypothetical protein